MKRTRASRISGYVIMHYQKHEEHVSHYFQANNLLWHGINISDINTAISKSARCFPHNAQQALALRVYQCDYLFNTSSLFNEYDRSYIGTFMKKVSVAVAV